jgi:folylpolyglutamate synthase/dihydropteroate synthase
VLEVLRQEAVLKQATLYEVEPRRSAMRTLDGGPAKLTGRVQEENLHLAMAVITHLKLQPKGFDQAYWPCRLEAFALNHVPVIIDGAHNEDSIVKLLAEVHTRYPGAEVWAVFGAGKDKNVSAMANRVGEDVDRVMVVQSSHFAATNPADLALMLPSDARMYKLMDKDAHNMTVAEGLAECLSQAAQFRTRLHQRERKLTKSESRAQLQSLQAQADYVVLVVCGSLFVAAEAREYVFANNPRAFMPDDWVRAKDPAVL